MYRGCRYVLIRTRYSTALRIFKNTKIQTVYEVSIYLDNNKVRKEKWQIRSSEGSKANYYSRVAWYHSLIQTMTP